MKKQTIYFSLFLLTLVNIFSFPTQLNAAEQKISDIQFEEYDITDELNESEISLLQKQSEKLAGNPNSIATQETQEDVDFSNPTFTKLDHKEKNEVLYTISYNILGEEHALSSLDLIYDESLNLKMQKEIHMKDYNDSNVSLDVWVNNVQEISVQDTKENLENQNESQTDSPIATAASGYWGCMNNCLAAGGVSSWMIGLIGTACAIVCAGTAGAGCIPCLTGLGMTQIQIFFNCSDKC